MTEKAAVVCVMFDDHGTRIAEFPYTAAELRRRADELESFSLYGYVIGRGDFIEMKCEEEA